jgi:hypothetical protein
VVGNSILLYLVWCLPYVVFMLVLGGIDLPKTFQKDGITPNNPRWDTIFHSKMRQGVGVLIGQVFRRRAKSQSLQRAEENNYDWIDFTIYMVLHMSASIASIYVFAYPCFASRRFHLFVLSFATVLAVTRGANSYTYYTTKMHSKSLRKQFASILEESKQE